MGKKLRIAIFVFIMVMVLGLSSYSFAEPSLEMAISYKSSVVKLIVMRNSSPVEPLMTGTGFFIHESGLLITNHHVVEYKVHHENNYTLLIQQFFGEEEYKLYYGSVFSTYPQLDIALVQISSIRYDGNEYFEEGSAPHLGVFETIPFSSSLTNEDYGKKVTTIGFPSIEMYRGFDEENVLGVKHLMSTGTIIGKMGPDIKVSCPSIVPGASGSPVFSEEGVIGIAHAMYNDGVMQYGLIIPIFKVIRIIPSEYL